jgi:MFS family permease
MNGKLLPSSMCDSRLRPAGLQSITYYEDYFNHPHGSTQGLLNAIQSVGGIVSLFTAPYAADYGGRKWTIFFGCLVVVIAGLVQCFAVNVGMFTAARFLIGLGSGFSGLASPLLITELAHPCERGKVSALYNTQYYFGGTTHIFATESAANFP